MAKYLKLALALLFVLGCGGSTEIDGPGMSLDFPHGTIEDSVLEDDLVEVSLEDEGDEESYYRVRSGDVLHLSLVGEQEMDRDVPVGPDGRISYHMAHDIMAAGKTFDELRAAINAKLTTHYKEPNVSITGKAYTGNTATVLGMVRKPGPHIVRSDTRLLDLLALAGDIRSSYSPYHNVQPELPDLKRAFLLRKNRFVQVSFEALLSNVEEDVARNNIRVRAGDRIYIPTSSIIENKIIVLGEVTKPQVLRFQKNISLLEAVGEAGGMRNTAWERRAIVVRGSLRHPKIMMTNLRKIELGQAVDIPLESGDVVFVPKHALAKSSEVVQMIIPMLNAAESVDRLSN